MDLQFYMRRATEDRRDKILELKDDLARELNSYFHQDGLEVLLFGSYQTRLSDNRSDADFSLVDSTGSSVSITVDVLAAALRQLGYVNVVAIGSARIPIVTFYERHRSIPYDIAPNQRHGAYNSKLIDTYRRIDDRFTSLFLQFELWPGIAGNITKANVNKIRGAFRRASDTLVKGDLVGAFLKNAPL